MVKMDFGEWLPDLPENENPGALLVKNALPKAKSYTEFKSLTPFSNAVDGMVRGNFWARSTSEVIFNFIGTQAKLYHMSDPITFSDVSKPATTYVASFWDFVSFQNRVIATDGGATDLQYYDMGVSATFDTLPGTPPRFKTLAVVRDFIVGGNYQFGTENEPGGFAWSGFNNTEIWTPALKTQSNRVPSRGIGGQVQRIVGGAVGVMLRENAILSLQYVGPPTVFKADDVLVQHGTPAPRSVCWTKYFIFYYSDEGFFKLDRRNFELTPIGSGKVDDWFRANSAPSDILNMVGAVRREKSIVYWIFKSSSSSPIYDRVIVFNYVFNKWAYAELSMEWLGEFATTGANLDTLDAILGGNIDTASIPMDTDAFAGGLATLFAFDASHIANSFDGTALVADIDTTEFALENSRQMINGVRPIVSGAGSMQVAPITRALISDNPAVGTFINLNRIGQADFRKNSRYFRFRVRIMGGFVDALRVEFASKKRGRQ